MHTFEETAHGEASRPYKNPSPRTRDEAKIQAGLLEENFSGPGSILASVEVLVNRH